MKRVIKRSAIVTETGFGPPIVITLIENGGMPYLYVETDEEKPSYGYIKDRDVKRLKKWCEACLAFDDSAKGDG